MYLLILRRTDPRCTCGQGCDSGGQSQLTVAAAAAAAAAAAEAPAGRVRRTLINTGCTGHGCTWQPQTMVWGPPPELLRDLRPPPPRFARWSTCNWHGCTGQPQRAAAPRRPAPCTRLHTRSIQRPACDWQSAAPHHRQSGGSRGRATASILSARPRSPSALRGMIPSSGRPLRCVAHWSTLPPSRLRTV